MPSSLTISTTHHHPTMELPALQITNWPLRQQPRLVLITSLVVAALGLFVSYATGHRAAGFAAVTVILLTTWRMWIPVRFELDVHGVQQVVWTRRWQMPWARVARYEVDPNGVLLLHQADAFPLSALRGIYIHSPQRHEELMQLITFYASQTK